MTDLVIKPVEGAAIACKRLHNRLIGAICHNDITVFIQQGVEGGLVFQALVEKLSNLLEAQNTSDVAAVFTLPDHRRKHCDHRLGAADPAHNYFREHRLESPLQLCNERTVSEVFADVFLAQFIYQRGVGSDGGLLVQQSDPKKGGIRFFHQFQKGLHLYGRFRRC